MDLRVTVDEEGGWLRVEISAYKLPVKDQGWGIKKRGDYLTIEREGIIVATSTFGMSPFDAAVDLMFEEIKKATRGLTEQIGAKIRQLTGEPTIQFDQSYPVRSE